MSKVDFYNDLLAADDGTMDLSGMALMAQNNHKWHICKSRSGYISHACGSGGPANPNETSNFSDDYYEIRFDKGTELVGVMESLEYDRMCSNCKRIIENTFEIEQLIMTVPRDVHPDATKEQVERFIRRLSVSE